MKRFVCFVILLSLMGSASFAAPARTFTPWGWPAAVRSGFTEIDRLAQVERLLAALARVDGTLVGRG